MLELGEIHCHHKIPLKCGGTDRYGNLIIVHENVHRLIHATDKNIVSKYLIGILICLYTGIRIGELCALEWKNIDLKRGVISIKQTLYRIKSDKGKKKTEIVIAPPKSDTSVRDIPLPKFLTAKLKAIEHGGGFLINRKGKFIEPTVYARRYKAILKELGIRDVKFHTTRHTFATRALEIGMDIKTLSEILGHASPTVTLNIYAHSLPEHKAKEMERLGKMYNPS